MPIYEYRCQECHYEFERMQKFSDPPVATCPTCDGAVQKLISRSAFHLKGSGWYVTDYARNGGEKSDSSDKGTAEKPAAEKRHVREKHVRKKRRQGGDVYVHLSERRRLHPQEEPLGDGRRLTRGRSSAAAAYWRCPVVRARMLTLNSGFSRDANMLLNCSFEKPSSLPERRR